MWTIRPGTSIARGGECGCVHAAGSIFDALNNDDRDSLRAKASFWLEGIYATIAISVVVFFALFLDDFRMAVLPTDLDVSCEYITGLVLVGPALLFSRSRQARCTVALWSSDLHDDACMYMGRMLPTAASSSHEL